MRLKEICDCIDIQDINWKYSAGGEHTEWIMISGKNYYSVRRMESDSRVLWELKANSEFGDFSYGSSFRFEYDEMSDSYQEGQYLSQALESITNGMRAYCTHGSALRMTETLANAAIKAGYTLNKEGYLQ